MNSATATPLRPIRYAICGLSLRGIYHFLLPLMGKSPDGANFNHCANIVGILDVDKARVMEFLKMYNVEIPFFSADDGAAKMIEKAKPDCLLVAGPDYTHCEHILAGLKAGLKVIAEKPAVINSRQAQAVLKAEREYGGKLVVAHNYRYASIMREVKKVVLSGAIGRITNVEMAYNLDTLHGASYFFRWNRERKKSGGLSVHKSVHHLDLINWLIDSPPELVFAFGRRNYYGPEGAHRPLRPDGAPLPPAETRRACPYFRKHYASKGIDPDEPMRQRWSDLNPGYFVQYLKDSYLYDEEIDIEDTYSAVISYASGASLAYSCNFSTPQEGFTLGINGTHGRLVTSHLTNPDPTGLSRAYAPEAVIQVMPLFADSHEIRVNTSNGGHGGADPLIRRDLFIAPDEESCSLGLAADSYAGALAIAAGEAIWRSIEDKRPYSIKELLGEEYREIPHL